MLKTLSLTTKRRGEEKGRQRRGEEERRVGGRRREEGWNEGRGGGEVGGKPGMVAHIHNTSRVIIPRQRQADPWSSMASYPTNWDPSQWEDLSPKTQKDSTLRTTSEFVLWPQQTEDKAKCSWIGRINTEKKYGYISESYLEIQYNPCQSLNNILYIETFFT